MAFCVDCLADFLYNPFASFSDSWSKLISVSLVHPCWPEPRRPNISALQWASCMVNILYSLKVTKIFHASLFSEWQQRQFPWHAGDRYLGSQYSWVLQVSLSFKRGTTHPFYRARCFGPSIVQTATRLIAVMAPTPYSSWRVAARSIYFHFQMVYPSRVVGSC